MFHSQNPASVRLSLPAFFPKGKGEDEEPPEEDKK
jgi:hypothetical protein